MIIIDMGYAYFGVVLDDAWHVCRAPPIAKWMCGEPALLIRDWVEANGGRIIAITP